MNRLKVFIVIVPLGVLLAIGLSCAVVADFFIFFENKCRQWVEDIYVP